MGMKKSEKEIVARQRELGEVTSGALQDFKASGGFQRFAPGPLQTAMPQLQGSTSFLGGASSPFAQSLAPQRLAGMTYANLPGTTTAFYPQANVAPPVATTPPASGGVGSGASQPGSSFDSLPEDSQSIIASIRQDLDLPTFGSYEELVPKPIPKKAVGNIGRQTRIKRENKAALDRWNKGKEEFESKFSSSSESDPEPETERVPDSQNPFAPTFGDDLMLAAQGGIAGLPMYMSAGGALAAPGQTLGGSPAGGLMNLNMGGVGGAGVGMNPTMPSASDKLEDKKTSSQRQSPYANMTREQLIALLEKDKQVDIGDELTRLGQALTPQILADGGEAFPRMNGPIDGPGTETSDDIPAMLSDGEFVVNAKAVRGVGRMNGAGKSKEEQRREGARMMYALQKAGEQAMRKA
jgi:hypothetical protein